MLLEPDGSPAWRSEDVLRDLPEHARRAHPRRDARARARARHRPAPRPSATPRRRAALPARRPRRDRARRSACAPRSRARTRWSAPRTSRSPPAPATSSCTSRCASSRGASRRSRCTCTSPSRTPSWRCARSTACARTSRCCSRWRPTRRSRAGATAGSRPRARRSSRPSRAPASRASSSTYAEYVEAIDVLIRCGAIPEPTFIWWDVRLQPKLGTLEVRVMDAQTRIRDTAALVALVQCLVRCEALGGMRRARARARARGARREPLPRRARRHPRAAARPAPRPLRARPPGRLATLVDACWPHARALGCERELQLLAHLAGDPGATRQRAIASEPAGLRGLLHTLQAEFSPPRPQLALAA